MAQEDKLSCNSLFVDSKNSGRFPLRDHGAELLFNQAVDVPLLLFVAIAKSCRGKMRITLFTMVALNVFSIGFAKKVSVLFDGAWTGFRSRKGSKAFWAVNTNHARNLATS